MSWHVIATFALGVLPITLTPGTSATLITQYVTLGGRRHGAAVIAGSLSGLVLHATFATVGLSAVVMASATAFAIVRYAGAAYLIGLGVYLLLTSSRRRTGPAPHHEAVPVPKVYRHALFANVLNPRAALIYLTLPTQVVTPDFPIAAAAFTLLAVHTVVATSWLSLWVQAISSAKRFRFFQRLARQFARAGGLLLIALGVRVAVTD